MHIYCEPAADSQTVMAGASQGTSYIAPVKRQKLRDFIFPKNSKLHERKARVRSQRSTGYENDMVAS